MKSRIFSLVILLFLSLGCNDDILDKDPQFQLTSAGFYLTETDAVLAINSAYAPFQEFNYFGWVFPMMGNLAAGDAIKGGFGSGDRADYIPFEDFTLNPGNTILNDTWVSIWPGVMRANAVLEHVSEIDMDSNLKNRILAEAKFIRALNYYNLTMAWGDLPIHTSVPNADAKPLPRSPISEVINFIEQDLLDAATVLPHANDYSPENVGRASKGAAHGLLARIYANEKRWSDAVQYADLVINSPAGYSLLTNYDDNFRAETGDNSVETIFEIQYATGASPDIWSSNGDWNGNQIATTYGPISHPGSGGWGFSAPTQELVDEYEAGDFRLPATIVQAGEEIYGSPFDPNNGHFQNTGSMFANRKYIEDGEGAFPGAVDSPTNYKILRFAEILLIKAEALNEMDNTAAAIPFVNRVRDRAGLDDVVTATQDELRDTILHETRVELALESVQYFTNVKKGYGATLYGDRGFVAGKSELFPVPQSEIDVNGWSQNPGY